VLWITGCAKGPDQERVVDVAAWTLDVDGGPQGVPVTLPRRLDDFVGHDGSFRLRTAVPIPPELRHRPLTLAIPFYTGIVDMRVNGEALPDAATHAELEIYRARGPHLWAIPAALTDVDALAFEMRAKTNRDAMRWMGTIPHLSDAIYGDHTYRAVKTLNDLSVLMSLGAAAMLAFVYLSLYVLDRRKKSAGYFALQVLTGVMYTSCSYGFTEPFLGPRDTAILGLAVPLAIWASVVRMRMDLPLPPVSRAWHAVPIVSGLWCLLDFWQPFPVSSAYWVVAVLASSVVYSLGALLLLAKRGHRSPRSALALAYWIVLAGASSTDAASWAAGHEILGGAHLASLAMLAIALVESLRLSREVVARTHQLEEQNLEVLRLNDELRRQIAARSRELANALARACGPYAAAHAFSEGDVVDGRYRVVRTLGAGAMATVFEVRRVADERRFALKILRGSSDASALARFAREAHLACRITHPNVVAMVDVAVTEAGILYLVMEFVEGAPLSALSKEFGRPRWVLPVLSQIAEGLAVIHGKGVVHRDLKPANVLVESSDGHAVAKIADFGISTMTLGETASDTLVLELQDTLDAETRSQRAVAQPDVTLTRTGMLVGTPRYMAPELARGASARPSADVFAFGAIAYEVLTGAFPFADDAVFARLHGRSYTPPPALEGLSLDLDPSVAAILDACLRTDPDARPSARELADALAIEQPAPTATWQPLDEMDARRV
jgi:hypothetical protein